MVPSDGRSSMEKAASVSVGRLVPLPPSHQEPAPWAVLCGLVSRGAPCAWPKAGDLPGNLPKGITTDGNSLNIPTLEAFSNPLEI